MSIDVKIRQRLFGTKTLPLEIILGPQLAYGDYRNDCLEENVLGDTEFVAYDPARIGRGFSVVWNAKEIRKVELRLLQPSTKEELSAFYGAVRRVAEYWGGSLTVDGSKMRLSEFLSGFESAVAFNDRTLRILVDKVLGGQSDSLTLYAAKWPLVMGRQEALAFSQDPACFGSWLNEKQSVSAIWSKLKIFAKDESYEGFYNCEAGHCYIFPQKPSPPFGIVDPKTGSPIRAEDIRWAVCLDDESDDGRFELPYSTFLQRLPAGKQSYYDANHFILESLTPEELREMTAEIQTNH